MPKLPYMQFYAADFLVDVQTLRTDITGAWILLLCLIWLKSKDGSIRLTNGELANLWKVDEISVKEDIASMVASNLFDHTFDEKTEQNIITSRRISRDRKRLEMKSSWMSRQRVDKKKTHKRQDVDAKKQISDTESDTDIKDSSSNSRLTDFDIFWKEYPRKVGRGAALKAWERAVKKAQEGAIIGGLRRAKKSFDWYKDGGQFIPHPTTWLNQERWLDEVRGASPDNPATSNAAEILRKKIELEKIAHREWERLHPITGIEPDEVPF